MEYFWKKLLDDFDCSLVGNYGKCCDCFSMFIIAALLYSSEFFNTRFTILD